MHARGPDKICGDKMLERSKLLWFHRLSERPSMSDSNFRRGPHAAKNKQNKGAEVADASVSAADERKTVILDEDLEGVEFDDRVWLYWKRNKGFIISTVVSAFAIIIGVQGWKVYSAKRADSLAEAFAAAGVEGLEKFSEQNPGTTLAGVALLEVADEAYKAGKYGDAVKAYNRAASELGSGILKGRAMLGAAVCEYSMDVPKGVLALKSVYGNVELARGYRAHAGYLYALGLSNSGKTDEAKSVMKELAGDPGNGVFASMARQAMSTM